MSNQAYDLAGKKVQGYTVSKPIGQGKFSIVYRAENQQGIPYALKKIKIFDMADQKQRDKCLKEVELMKPLNHPNIIQYVDSFIHNNELIIVTEWAEKGDLKKLIKEKQSDQLQFDQPTIWEYMRQISSALNHMHEKRIMHRDLKPANIFISHDSTLKIGDLGLGRSFSSGTLEAFSKVGTPLYMSPELIQDSGYTENADVWSLGCICYELAQLKSPFRNSGEKMSLMDLFDNITKCNYRPISNKYSPELSNIIKSMIVVDPSKRFSSEQVFKEATKFLQNNKKPLLDPIIAMDDIHIKLGLLNYETMFCKFAERKPLHKLYFALEDNSGEANNQLYYFLELSYWIIALSKPDKKKDKLPIYTKTLINWNTPEDACSKFLLDLEGYGIKFEDIEVNHIRNGYGQSVCYLLNQVLNRELIRMNFQFKKPADMSNDLDNGKQQVFEEKEEREIEDEEKQHDLEESLEEESQFEQSVFFNKHNRKQRILDGALIEKIEELDNQDDRTIIVARVDEHQWKAECLRLEKQFNEITTSAKESRKKHGYANIEVTKICSAKLTDLIRYVQPASTTLFKKIEEDLTAIKSGENRINQSYNGVTKNYSQANQLALELQNRSIILTNYIRENQTIIEKTEERINEFEQKIKLATAETQNNRASDLKKGISRIQKQIKDLSQKSEIISWQLRKHMLNNTRKNKKEEFFEESQMEQL